MAKTNATKNPIGQLNAQIKQKQAVIKKLLSKEMTLEKKMMTSLARIIAFENKQVARAKKNKSKTQTSLLARLNELKKRQKEYQQRKHLIKGIRTRQQKIQTKIEKLKQFVAKHKPAKKEKVLAQAAKTGVKPTHRKKTHKRMVIHQLHKAMHKALKAAKKPHLIKKLKKVVAALEPKTQEPTESVQVETVQPIKETPQAAETEPAETAPEVSQAVSEPLTVPESKLAHFEKNGISFDHPAWPESANKSTNAEFSVEQNNIRFELFFSLANPEKALDENVQAWINQQPDIKTLSQENINHFVFLTYSSDDTKHYALFGQHETMLVRLEASGEANALDEQSGLIVQVFKSFALEE